MPITRRHIILILLLLPTMAATSQPHALAEIRSGIETKTHFYETTWVCTGDTIAFDSTETDGVLCQIDGFWITCQEVTQDLWMYYMPSNPSAVKGDLLPVTNVSRASADSLCFEIQFRILEEWSLPTIKEWRYAYEGGIFSEGYNNSGSNNINFVGWTAHNSNGKLHEGGKLIPNELGIFDMDGNAAEIVTDGDSTRYAGRTYRSKVRKSKSQLISTTVAPECCGLRLVWHQPIWFNRNNERVFRR